MSSCAVKPSSHEVNTRAYLSALIRAQSCPCEVAEYSCADEEKFAWVSARAAEQIEARRKNPPGVCALTVRAPD